MTAIDKRKKERGFSFVELSVVMVVSAIVMVALTSSWGQYKNQERVYTTQKNSSDVMDAMVSFYALQGRYPCPANPILPQTDPNYGRENCPAPAVPVPGTCAGGICRGIGADGDGDGTPDTVLIGTVPYVDLFDAAAVAAAQAGYDMTDPVQASEANKIKYEMTVNLASRSTLDGWGRKLSYVVTESMTKKGTFNEAFSAIQLRKRNGVSPTILTAPTATLPGGLEKFIHFAVISHGPDGVGAYTEEGKLVSPCAGAGIDRENCDVDGLVLTELTMDIRSLGAGATHYDDMVAFKHWGVTDLWGYASGGAAIINRNPSNVGIGIDAPINRLDVGGNIKSYEIHTDKICDSNNNCISPGTFSNPGVACPSGQAVVRVGDNNISCASVVFNAINGSCPGGKYIIGIKSSGGVICGP